MNVEDFQILDKETIDKSVIKRNLKNFYHQQGVRVNDPDQTMETLFGESNFYHQIGNAYFHQDITKKRLLPCCSK